MYYTPESFGALGDGQTDDTFALQAALNACAATGGTVVLSGGKTYLSGSLFMGSRTELRLEHGSVLRASPRLEDYFRPDQPSSEGASGVGTPVVGKPAYVFLYAFGQSDIRLTGSGTVDGSGTAFVHRIDRYYVNGDFYPRPTLIYFENCRHLTVRDVTLTNVAFWTLHLGGCTDAEITCVRILNPMDTANSDGIDVDHSRQVRISGCHITCADDCVCMKNTLGNREYPFTRDVTVTGCTLSSTSAAFKIGTEGVDNFENIIFSDSVIFDSNRGVSVQVRDAGSVRGVMVSHVMITTRRFSPHFWGSAEPIAITVRDRDHAVPCGTVRDVHFDHVTCYGENGALIWADEAGKIDDILFSHTALHRVDTSKWPKGVYDLRPAADEPGLLQAPCVPIYRHNAGDVHLEHFTAEGFADTSAQRPQGRRQSVISN